jgi:hypothetical protein
MAFGSPTEVPAATLRDALLWKYGHLGKPRIPEAHQKLIAGLQRGWPKFSPTLANSPEGAFAQLDARFGGSTRFITVAFLVHLLFQEQIPIIDQHNFRAVNQLIGQVRRGWPSKKKPSRYADIELVASFMNSILRTWRAEDRATTPDARKLDVFLMMYGKSIKRAI